MQFIYPLSAEYLYVLNSSPINHANLQHTSYLYLHESWWWRWLHLIVMYCLSGLYIGMHFSSRVEVKGILIRWLLVIHKKINLGSTGQEFKFFYHSSWGIFIVTYIQNQNYSALYINVSYKGPVMFILMVTRRFAPSHFASIFNPSRFAPIP